MYNYLQLADETQIAYSNILDDNTIQVSIERPVENGFDAATCLLPSYTWRDIEGFSDGDIEFFTDFIRNNAPLIYRLSREAGKVYA